MSRPNLESPDVQKALADYRSAVRNNLHDAPDRLLVLLAELSGHQASRLDTSELPDIVKDAGESKDMQTLETMGHLEWENPQKIRTFHLTRVGLGMAGNLKGRNNRLLRDPLPHSIAELKSTLSELSALRDMSRSDGIQQRATWRIEDAERRLTSLEVNRRTVWDRLITVTIAITASPIGALILQWLQSLSGSASP